MNTLVCRYPQCMFTMPNVICNWVVHYLGSHRSCDSTTDIPCPHRNCTFSVDGSWGCAAITALLNHMPEHANHDQFETSYRTTGTEDFNKVNEMPKTTSELTTFQV